jgi:hypothetical protein
MWPSKCNETKKRKWQNPCHSGNTTFCTPSQQSTGTRHPAAVVAKPHLPFWVRTSWPVCRSPKISRFCDILHTLKNPEPDSLLPGNKQGTSSSWYEATSYLVYCEEQDLKLSSSGSNRFFSLRLLPSRLTRSPNPNPNPKPSLSSHKTRSPNPNPNQP